MNLDKDKAAAWLNQRWVGAKTCPICSKNNWSISDEPLELRPYHGGGLVLGGAVYPVFSITCGSCGHTMFFNALVAGLLSTKADSPKVGEPPAAPLDKPEVPRPETTADGSKGKP